MTTLQPCTPPSGVFRGSNFMTPWVLGYYQTAYRGRTAYVELSEGVGMHGESIFGVTVRQANGERFEAPDPGGLFDSRRAAEAYVADVFVHPPTPEAR